MGKITDGEVIHTIEAKDVPQVLAKYQSYEVLQNSNISQIFQQILPIEVEHTTAEYEKKVYAEEYEFYVDREFPRVCTYGNFNHAETTTMLNDMFDEETTKIILAFGCGVRKLLFATEPDFPDNRPIWFSVRSIFYKRTRGSLVLQTYDKDSFNKEVALFVGIVFELCKDLEYDEEFDSEFAHEFDFPNYLDQLEGKKKEKTKKKSKPLVKIAKEKPKSRRLFGGTQKPVKGMQDREEPPQHVFTVKDCGMDFLNGKYYVDTAHKSGFINRKRCYRKNGVGKAGDVFTMSHSRSFGCWYMSKQYRVKSPLYKVQSNSDHPPTTGWVVGDSGSGSPLKLVYAENDRKKLAKLQNTGSLFNTGSGGLFGKTKNTGSLVSPVHDKASTSVLVGRLSRSQLEQLVVNAADRGKTITKQVILDLLPSNTQTQSRGLFGANA